ncbi:MAG: PDZ domain-containing protein, partial [Planctomycetes bacterium]|nr:PDZ domain-containing protein [Planctomycetota bacterium]
LVASLQHRRHPVFRLFAIACLLAFTSASNAQELQQKIEFAKSRVYPALVNISVVSRDFSGGRTRRFPAAGSGTIISPAGHAITNFHVVENAQRVTCTLPTGESIRADIIASDPAIDLAVLQLRMGERESQNTPLPFATLGDSSTLEVGDYVLAVGNPLGLSSSMTLGIASNTARVFTDFLGNEVEDLDIGEHATGMFTRWIQHDALILPGNSGGPLVDLRGEIVGMNTRGGSGVAFATPANLLKKSINRILSFGEVRRGWLGTDVKPVKKLGRETGALVTAVVPESPAAIGGIRPGDVILKLDDHVVRCRFLEELPLFHEQVADREPGAELHVTYEREGATHETTVRLAEWEPSTEDIVEVRALGGTVTRLTRRRALRMQLPDVRGLVVTGVRPGHPLDRAKPRVETDDVIVALDGVPTLDPNQFATSIESGEGDRELTLRLRRGREDLIAVVEIEADQERDRPRVLTSAWIGIRTQVLTPAVAQAVGQPDRRGYRITDVLPGTRASEAGLAPGDLLVAMDGDALNAYRDQDARDLERLLENEYSPGEMVELTLLREGESRSVRLELEPSPKAVSEAATGRNEFFELTVRELLPRDRMDRNWPESQTGVVVTECTNGGWAAMAGIRPNDLLVSANGRALDNVAAFEQCLSAFESERPQSISVYLRRGTSTTFAIVQPEWKKP